VATPAIETYIPPWVQPFGSALRPCLLPDAGRIKPGDWIADLGTLRQVKYVDSIGLAVGTGLVHIVHFVEQSGVENLARGFSASTSVTVWRAAASEELGMDVAAPEVSPALSVQPNHRRTDP
jgi:hypothetical protein